MSRVTIPEAIKANPGKSNRAIAADIGVAEGTVRTARQGAQDYAPEKVTGQDGKSYPATQPTKPSPTRGKDAIRERVLEAIRHQLAIEFFSGKTTGREFWCRVRIGLPPRPQPISWERR